jgi:hypothetical protein
LRSAENLLRERDIDISPETCGSGKTGLVWFSLQISDNAHFRKGHAEELVTDRLCSCGTTLKEVSTNAKQNAGR